MKFNMINPIVFHNSYIKFNCIASTTLRGLLQYKLQYIKEYKKDQLHKNRLNFDIIINVNSSKNFYNDFHSFIN